MQRPIILGVLQRIEYLYRDKDQLVAPKLDGDKKFGSYGLIDVTVIFYYPSIPGRLYHPIYNADEAAWWLDFYKLQSEVVTAFFVPAVQQSETMLPFEIPELGEITIPEPSDGWYNRVNDEYTS